MLNNVIEIAHKAGDAIMSVYQRDFATYEKKDESPLTEADLAAHEVIMAGLQTLTPDVPVLSEESADISWEERQKWDTYWLVDPLDGTKEFIKRNGEFTVNIALIKNHKAVLGVVYTPVLKQFYYADENGAFKMTEGEAAVELKVADHQEGEIWNVVASRSHMSDETKAFVEKLGKAELVSMGSSLKLCLVAEGKAHVYPRFALTSEWDTAAAQCVVEMAGGKVVTPEFEPVLYNAKENILNPFFIVCGGAADKIQTLARS
ncbi:3'(2'),5'-bisphosphate nucleotidase CysQ [Endozoicomonas euniceicola]|uniref:3'(2'),5'-bisphosphate nucleotidase CysQ n=1 Tax=Endozoicomonas euniceicola TaxID=1234143 RepID=A0ABY6H0G3_9GAMM|nr:3'(2'),5'-bisphosphate nucleotidase CysQ [Endozoicomonas euniceicola]UYM18545.1 3'(2'),5'-bisphosphate nucleotidase CysQ [Endozoicomonas euniceicola]